MQTNLLCYSDADKRKARIELSKIRADIYDKAEYSALLCNGIATSDDYKNTDILLLYFPTRSEPDLTPLAEIAWHDGKQVAFPISRTDSLTLDFRVVSSLDELCEGAYGIREPDGDAEETIVTDRTLCVVPALAIDRDGYRLGYGKGYYDRFLASFCGLSIGIVFSDFLVGELPHGKYDIATDMIITEGGVIVPDEDTLTF
jgi:5-formyltetrahydrofolate cyclo-ligase